MSDLVVRRLLIDLETELPRDWAGDAFRTALFNALSMSFPQGEQFFIDAVRAGMQQLPESRRSMLVDVAPLFIGQEATHRRVHALFNAHLDRQGLVNTWEQRILRRRRMFDGQDVRHMVAVTVAYEHFTAILADWMLAHPGMLADAAPRLRTMWLWHACEELEHRAVAFDLYQALDGSHAWRVRWFRRVTLIFLSDLMRQTVRNLWHDGDLFRWSTWRAGASHLFGRDGIVKGLYQPWRRYFRPEFHPGRQDDRLSREWLRLNADAFAELPNSVGSGVGMGQANSGIAALP